jgi:hypothetical protein
MQNDRHAMLKPVLAVLALALTGGLVLPIAGYLAGKRTIGAYAGRLGLSDYLGSIYTAAFRGELLAWWLLLTPALIATLWYVLARVDQRAGRQDDD